MEPQDLAVRELRAIKKTLCYISSTACAICLVCTATTLVVLLSRTKSSEESTEAEHQTQRQGSSGLQGGSKWNKFGNVSWPSNQTAAHAQLKWWHEAQNGSSTVLWRIGSTGEPQGMKYADGNITILTDGLYFLHCQLHFAVNQCFGEKEDLISQLVLNGKGAYVSIQTVQPHPLRNDCMLYTNQHLSLQTRLRLHDNVSVRTSHPHWLKDDGMVADSTVFGAFKIDV